MSDMIEDALSRMTRDDEIDGYDVFVQLKRIDTANGPQPVPAWHYLLIARNPLLGQLPLVTWGEIPSPMPSQEDIDVGVRAAVETIRATRAQIMAPGN